MGFVEQDEYQFKTDEARRDLSRTKAEMKGLKDEVRNLGSESDRTTGKLNRMASSGRGGGAAGRVGRGGAGAARRGGGLGAVLTGVAAARGLPGRGLTAGSAAVRAGGAFAVGAAAAKFGVDILEELTGPRNIEDPLVRAATERDVQQRLDRGALGVARRVTEKIPIIGGTISELLTTGGRLRANLFDEPFTRESAAEFLAEEAREQREQQIATARSMAIAMQGLERNSRPAPTLGSTSGW